MNTYEYNQIQRVLDNGPDHETGGEYRIKIFGATHETHHLVATEEQVKAIQAIMSIENE